MKSEPQIPKIQSTHVILILDGNYILQLRDNKPDIASAGQWSLFGGEVKTGETPEQAIRREVSEELSIAPEKYSYLWYIDYYFPFMRSVIRTWFFVSDVTSVWLGHKLLEGRAVRDFRFKQLAKLDIPEVMYKTLERFHRQREKVIAMHKIL